ncbi:MAG: hypothetical protein ACFFAN_12585 [Promethearchaeota archaeon]
MFLITELPTSIFGGHNSKTYQTHRRPLYENLSKPHSRACAEHSVIRRVPQ